MRARWKARPEPGASRASSRDRKFSAGPHPFGKSAPETARSLLFLGVCLRLLLLLGDVLRSSCGCLVYEVALRVLFGLVRQAKIGQGEVVKLEAGPGVQFGLRPLMQLSGFDTVLVRSRHFGLACNFTWRLRKPSLPDLFQRGSGQSICPISDIGNPLCCNVKKKARHLRRASHLTL